MPSVDAVHIVGAMRGARLAPRPKPDGRPVVKVVDVRQRASTAVPKSSRRK